MRSLGLLHRFTEKVIGERFLLPGTTRQRLLMSALDYGLVPLPRLPIDKMQAWRTVIPNVGELVHPIGLAAGFDREGSYLHRLNSLGFSFLEVGSVTPRPQPAQHSYRLTRRPLGLFTDSELPTVDIDSLAGRLQAIDWPVEFVPLAVNVCMNRDTIVGGAVYDYVRAIEKFKDLAHFIVVNLATPELEGLPSPATNAFVRELAQELEPTILSKVWLKLAPTNDRNTLQTLVTSIADQRFAGLILTDSRRVEQPRAGRQSGHDLVNIASSCLEWAYQITEGELPLIASGGILTGHDVVQRLRRGACAVEVFSACIYFGVGVVARLLTEMQAELQLLGFSSVSDARNSYWS